MTPIPTDEYNGLTVSFTEMDTGVFRRIHPLSTDAGDADGPRRSVDLVAPGADIIMPPTGGGPYAADSGSSFAAPHVTGTVALLQQYALNRIVNGVWDATGPRQHEVMKAVIMNSADKIVDQNDGLRLGMEKTIYKRDGISTWFNSDARDSADNPGGRALPLDLQMGTGQLNAHRAFSQFEPGNCDPAVFPLQAVPLTGWNYNFVGAGQIKKYPFVFPLRGSSYVSITLAWDRVVTLNDTVVQNGQWDVGETFTASPLADLNLYLMPKGALTLGENLWSSESSTDSVEHIFFQVKPDDAEYEFWVTGDNIGSHYAVAWWALGGIVEQRPSLGQNSVETVRQITSSLLSGLQSRSQNVVSDDLDPAVIFSAPLWTTCLRW